MNIEKKIGRLDYPEEYMGFEDETWEAMRHNKKITKLIYYYITANYG
jgi:hypothetical protein